MSTPHRALPQAPESEKGILNAMMQGRREMIEEILGRVVEDHFLTPGHARIFVACREMYESGKPIDNVTLCQHLMDRGALEQVGGAYLIAELYTDGGTAANWPNYAETLREKFILRRILADCADMTARVHESPDDVLGVIEEHQSRALEIGTLHAGSDALMPISKSEVVEMLQAIEQRYHTRGKIGGLSTGFVDLDRMTDGLKGKQLWVIAGFTGSGKSALAGNIATHIAINAMAETNLPVAFFSLEMPREDLIERAIFAEAQINLGRVRDGLLSEKGFADLQAAAMKLIQGKLLIDDTPGLTIAQFRAQARKAVVKQGARLLIVDYVQIMAGTSRKNAVENRALEVKEIMQGLRETAKQLNVPVLALAQLNRQMLDRPGGRPSLADLKESAAIAEEANLVGLLWQPSYMVRGKEKREALAEKFGVSEDDLDMVMELDIAKQRKGPRGPVVLRFVREFTRFEGMTKDYLSNNKAKHQRQLEDADE